MKKIGYGAINALETSEKLSVPLTILWNLENGQKVYHGFVPGLTKKDITSTSLEDCKKQLKIEATKLIKNMALKKSPFPFFPNKEEILKDYTNVCFIAFIKIK